MATGEVSPRIDDPEAVKAEWLDRLNALVGEVEGWARASGWRTRRIAKTVNERRLGTYKVPVLLMEKDTVEVVLNPVARFVPGADGAVDLYVAPAYDDIASLYLEGDHWVVHYGERPDPMATESVVDITPRPYAETDDPHDPRRDGRQWLNVKRSSTGLRARSGSLTWWPPPSPTSGGSPWPATPSLPTKTSPRDLVAAAEQVESTYLIRMWAEFETALRSYRRHITGDPDDQIRTRNLIDWTAGVRQGRAISADVRDDVHEVREYRNFLVHERDDQAPPAAVAIEEARKRLNTLLHCLPIQW